MLVYVYVCMYKKFRKKFENKEIFLRMWNTENTLLYNIEIIKRKTNKEKYIF